MADRDGDGLYMPHYDINRYGNDGWGIRDVAGTGSLGSPAYSAEQSRVLRALNPNLRTFPPEWPSRLQAAFEARERSRSPVASSDSKRRRYRVVNVWKSKACDPDHEKVDEAELQKYPGKLLELVNHGEFCETTSVKSTFNLKLQRVSDVTLLFYPGPRNQYGFMSWFERLSASYRNDGGHGLSFVGPPIPGTEVPIFGGWLVGKGNLTFEGSRVRLSALDAMYTPSASRSAAWYVAIGREWQFDHATGDTRRQVAEEIGIKFRFLAEGQLLKTFLGGRIGVRASGSNPIEHARLIFEVGAGSW